MTQVKILNIRGSLSTYRDLTTRSKGLIDRYDYFKIAAMYTKFISEKILDGYDVFLPYSMGSVQLKGTKQKLKIGDNGIEGGVIDWKITRTIWKENKKLVGKKFIYYTNEHTDGYRYKFVWSKKNVNVKYKWFYKFLASRKNKTRSAELIRNGKEYINN